MVSTPLSTIDDSHFSDSRRSSKRQGKTKVQQTDYMADSLMQIFDINPSDSTNRKTFLKFAWHLPEYIIRNAIESAKQPNITSPIKYFTRICVNEMQKLQQTK